jgi:hypothetical protein
MDVVLGVSTTPTTVRMVVVDGHKADGAVIEHDSFDIVSTETSAADQVIDALVGTREAAFAGGHRVVCTGIMCSDRAQADELRSTLAERGVDGVAVVSQLQAAAALGHAAGILAGYDKTAVLVVTGEMATVSVIDTADASILAVDSRPVTPGQTRGELTDMLTALRGQWSAPDGIVVVASDRDAAVAQELAQDVLSIPASAPGDGALALARGAALAAASIAEGDLTTMALAYSQDPDAATGLAGIEVPRVDELDSAASARAGKPFMLVGSTMAAIFIIGVLTLVISLAVSIRPTVDSRPGAKFSAAPPVAAAPAPPAVPNALPPVPQPAAAPPSPAAAPPSPAAPPPAPPAEAPVTPPVQAAPSEPAPAAPVPVAKTQPAAVPAPVAAAPPVDPAPAAPPPAPVAAAPPEPAPAAVPDNPPTGYVPGVGPPFGYAPGYGPQPAYGPGPGYGPQPAYGPGPGYGPQPAYGPGPGYGAGYGPQPAYGPGPGYGAGYGPQPAYGPGYGPGYAPPPPRIPIIPGILSIGPGPGPEYGPRGPGRFGSGPPWLWPSG